jgi:hypothetical protein
VLVAFSTASQDKSVYRTKTFTSSAVLRVKLLYQGCLAIG